MVFRIVRTKQGQPDQLIEGFNCLDLIKIWPAFVCANQDELHVECEDGTGEWHEVTKESHPDLIHRLHTIGFRIHHPKPPASLRHDNSISSFLFAWCKIMNLMVR